MRQPGLALGLDHSPQALAVDAEDALDGCRGKAACQGRLDERKDLRLVLAHPVVGLRDGEPDRLAHDQEELDRDAGAIGGLAECVGGQGRDAVVVTEVEDVERDEAAFDGLGDAVER